MCILGGTSGRGGTTAMSRVGMEATGDLFGYFKASGLIFWRLNTWWGELNSFQLVWVTNLV